MTSTLFQIGPLTIDCPGPFNADHTTRTFGGDFAVKPVVGALQRREFVGPADKRFTLSGKLYPYFFNRLGMSSGLSSVDMLEALGDAGQPQIVVRGDGSKLGYYLIEKATFKGATLSQQGIGHEIDWDVDLVQSPDVPTAASSITLLDQLFS